MNCEKLINDGYKKADCIFFPELKTLLYPKDSMGHFWWHDLTQDYGYEPPAELGANEIWCKIENGILHITALHVDEVEVYTHSTHNGAFHIQWSELDQGVRF